jgi:hypothetical protein
LGWQDSGKSYRRLEESLKRWLGVTLYYENAWWDKQASRWADVHFHLLDNLVLYHRRSGRPSARHDDRDALRSSFTWNEVVFRSFQAGYLKQIDVELYRSLALATAKRMYRFLDKRFHFSSRLQFDLLHFAHEHIGLSRRYDVAQLKRRLASAVRELESAGFLEPMDAADRYRRLYRGAWRVVFVKTASAVRRKASGAGTGLAQRLTQRGVTATSAARLVRRFPSQLIGEKIEVFDQLMARRDVRVSRNPAGYLVQSIRDDYQLPGGLKRPSCEGASSGRQASKGDVVGGAGQETARRQETVRADRWSRVQQYLNRLPPEDLVQLEQAAVASAPRVTADGYRRARDSGNARRLEQYRQLVLQHHVEHLLSAARQT